MVNDVHRAQNGSSYTTKSEFRRVITQAVKTWQLIQRQVPILVGFGKITHAEKSDAKYSNYNLQTSEMRRSRTLKGGTTPMWKERRSRTLKKAMWKSEKYNT